METKWIVNNYALGAIVKNGKYKEKVTNLLRLDRYHTEATYTNLTEEELKTLKRKLGKPLGD